MGLKDIQKSRVWLIVLTVFLLVPILFFSIEYWNRINAGIVESGNINADCDLHKASGEASFDENGKLVFSITPAPIKPLSPLDLQVELVNINAQSVQVDFEGIGVYMGFYRPELKREINNVFKGTAILSVCTLENMLWQATVIIKTDKGTIVAPFRFEVEQS